MKAKKLIELLEGMNPEEELYVRDDVYGLVPVEDIEEVEELISKDGQFVTQRVWQICP